MIDANYEIILYVASQERSRQFYEALFGRPVLDLPDMTEFLLTDSLKLGLMPENGIAKILGNKTPHPKSGSGIPRSELYIKSDNASEFFDRSIAAGGLLVSPFSNRDWGDHVAYVMDPDGHIIAFAKDIQN